MEEIAIGDAIGEAIGEAIREAIGLKVISFVHANHKGKPARF